jgi:hypothetical protein
LERDVKRLVVDLSTGSEQYVDMTPQEETAVRAACDEAAQQRAAEDARAADRTDARRQLKQKAKNDQSLALIARALGIDPNAPDPAQAG